MFDLLNSASDAPPFALNPVDAALTVATPVTSQESSENLPC